MFDLVISGGTLIDGTGAPPQPADVGVEDDRITAVGDLANAEARRRLNAAGHLVTPGFIDLHSHSDYTLLVDPRAHSQLLQGVTTEVVGNCGHGCAPIRDAGAVAQNIYGYQPGVELSWSTMAGYLERLEAARPALNVATLVPNGNLRLAVTGTADRPSTPEEVRAMSGLLEEGLDAGALGFSTGLEYPAERSCSPEELAQLCTVTARRNGLYATHTRNREVEALAAIEEQVEVARRAGVRLQVSHIIPRRGGPAGDWVRALKLVDRELASGLDIAFDSHTRLHGITNLANAVPAEELQAPPAQLYGNLGDPERRRAWRRHPSIIASFGLGGWDRVFVFRAPASPELEGRSLADLAPAGGDAWDAIFDTLRRNVEDVGAVLCTCHSYEEDWLRATFRHPLCVPGSDATALCLDGPLASATFLGAYTWAGWYFRRLVRELGDLSVESAVHRLTLQPARRARLRERGAVAPGWRADLAVFAFDEFAETGTLAEPNRPAVGMAHVIVNGQVAVEAGRPTGVLAGRVLRHGI